MSEAPAGTSMSSGSVEPTLPISSASSLADTIYAEYAPFIQDFIYNHSWNNLRGVQIAAGEALFTTQKNVLLCASTAAGKTEAAFFPILTDFTKNPPHSVGCLYISPLKALINDQFERLDELCAEAAIDVWHWHGDVSAAHKRQLLASPSGILQITPESLESLFINHNLELHGLFHDLRYIVIDEIHSLVGNERGEQTFSLISRLCRHCNIDPRRIGLSATIGNPSDVAEYLSRGSHRGVTIPSVTGTSQSVRLDVEYFEIPDPATLTTNPAEAETPSQQVTPDIVSPQCVDYIYTHSLGKKCIVFCNSRQNCEGITHELRGKARRQHDRDRFLIHHGNLSQAIRQDTEFTMKHEDFAPTTIATATLELGVDIGRLERAFQYGAPGSVSSFLQRLGRTGRRGNPSEMIFLIDEHPKANDTPLPQFIPWSLLQSIAIVLLYLEDKWVEPNTSRIPSLSLQLHQTLSILAAEGDCTPAELAGKVLLNPVFRDVDKEDYRKLLRHLVETDMIERMEDGNLILGAMGERLVNNYKFYAVFKEDIYYDVRSDGRTIGFIPKQSQAFTPGNSFGLAGRSWRIDEVDDKKLILYCHQIHSKTNIRFASAGPGVHVRILQKMREILLCSTKYSFISPAAQERLDSARQAFQHSPAHTAHLIQLGDKTHALLPWLGTRTAQTLFTFLAHYREELGITQFDPDRHYYYLIFQTKLDLSEFRQRVQELAGKLSSALELLPENSDVSYFKYDACISPELLRKWWAENYLDLAGMKDFVSDLL